MYKIEFKSPEADKFKSYLEILISKK